MGYYYQISNNYHLYLELEALESEASREVMAFHSIKNDHYNAAHIEAVKTFPLMQVRAEAWMEDLAYFMENPIQPRLFSDPFFNEVAVPMFSAWHERKSGQGDGMDFVHQIAAEDWQLACEQWIERRRK
jgi:hypothetical protein